MGLFLHLHSPASLLLQNWGGPTEGGSVDLEGAVSGNVMDSLTNDRISLAGRLSEASPAGVYLREKGVLAKDFNSYASRRANDEIMARATFANVRLVNRMASRAGPLAVHVPSGREASVFEVAEEYRREGTPLVVVAGKEYVLPLDLKKTRAQRVWGSQERSSSRWKWETWRWEGAHR